MKLVEIILYFIGMTIYCLYLTKITVYYVYYNDDGVQIPGLLVKRPFLHLTFIPFERGCGFSKQSIYRCNKHLITPMEDLKDE